MTNNMVKQIIRAEDSQTRKSFQKDGEYFLRVSEFYYDTIQGEGFHIGQPAAFLRLQGCSLNCGYCDTTSVWKYGSPYSYGELIELINSTMLIPRLKEGQHLVITGGSPLLQQNKLEGFIRQLSIVYGFNPYVEVENECIIEPSEGMMDIVDCWNNSPKLTNSGVPAKDRYKPNVITIMSELPNSWFKFVISHIEEWKEIDEFYLKPGLIHREQIILMPEGASKAEIEANREIVVSTALRHNVRYSTREHIILWDKKVGI